MAFAASLNHRRSVPLLITAGVHAVLLYWLLQYRPPMPKQPEAERWSVLMLLPSPVIPPKAEPERVTPPVSSRSTRAAAAASSSSQPSGSETLEPSTNNAITIAPEESGEQPSKPTIDWSAAAASAAKDAAARLDAKPQQRALDGSDKKEIAKPKKPSEFGWSKTKRFGFTPEGLPYIQLNRRCVWSILVACAIGKLPPPNRDLFEGMNEPDEVKDSIPDLKQQP